MLVIGKRTFGLEFEINVSVTHDTAIWQAVGMPKHDIAEAN